MSTTVVNISGWPDALLKEPHMTYVGRRCARRHLTASKFANPFKLGKDANREEVLQKYIEYLRSRPDLIEAAHLELKGKTLGCWCVNSEPPHAGPLQCHAQVLANVADGEDL